MIRDTDNDQSAHMHKQNKATASVLLKNRTNWIGYAQTKVSGTRCWHEETLKGDFWLNSINDNEYLFRIISSPLVLCCPLEVVGYGKPVGKLECLSAYL